MLKKITAITKITIAIVSSFAMMFINVNSATSVSPASADTSLATPYFYLNVTSCVETFDWGLYDQDLDSGIEESAPYNKQGCIRQENFASNGSKSPDVITTSTPNITYTTGATTINTPFYKDFNGNSNTTAKAVLGDMPVIGITSQNLNVFDVDGSVENANTCDRTEVSLVTAGGCIWTDDELNQIYSPQTARTGAPRLIGTGVDEIVRTDAGLSYGGGPCYTENGQMVKRTRIDVGGERERDASDVFPGIDEKTTAVACNFKLRNGSAFNQMSVNCGTEPLNGTTGETFMAVDQGLCAYQFIYVIDMPTPQECLEYWQIAEVDYEEYCLNFWKTRFQKLHNNTMEGNRFVYVKTYYGMFADFSFKCQTVGQTNCNTSNKYSHNGEWTNPDVNGPRKNFATDATREQLLDFLGQGFNIYTTEQLRTEINGRIQSFDGASTYAF